jgi:hypothetical protein
VGCQHVRAVVRFQRTCLRAARAGACTGFWGLSSERLTYLLGSPGGFTSLQASQMLSGQGGNNRVATHACIRVRLWMMPWSRLPAWACRARHVHLAMTTWLVTASPTFRPHTGVGNRIGD